MTDAQPQGSADEGTEPDPRFTFANERTFLAWSRTALALVVAGLGVVQLLPPFAIMERLGLERTGGAVRVGFCHYHTVEEVDRVLLELERVAASA